METLSTYSDLLEQSGYKIFVAPLDQNFASGNENDNYSSKDQTYIKNLNKDLFHSLNNNENSTDLDSEEDIHKKTIKISEFLDEKYEKSISKLKKRLVNIHKFKIKLEEEVKAKNCKL